MSHAQDPALSHLITVIRGLGKPPSYNISTGHLSFENIDTEQADALESALKAARYNGHIDRISETSDLTGLEGPVTIRLDNDKWIDRNLYEPLGLTGKLSDAPLPEMPRTVLLPDARTSISKLASAIIGMEARWELRDNHLILFPNDHGQVSTLAGVFRSAEIYDFNEGKQAADKVHEPYWGQPIIALDASLKEVGELHRSLEFQSKSAGHIR